VSDGDRTQEIVADLSPQERLVRRDNRVQEQYKRRVAYYSLALLSGITAAAVLADADVGTNWASVLESVVLAAGISIVSTMSADAVNAYASMRTRGRL